MHFSLIGGIGLPLFYVFFGVQATTHQQGTVFGLLESVRSLTELSGPVILALISITNLYSFLIPQSIVAFLLVTTLSLKKQKELET